MQLAQTLPFVHEPSLQLQAFIYIQIPFVLIHFYGQSFYLKEDFKEAKLFYSFGRMVKDVVIMEGEPQVFYCLIF